MVSVVACYVLDICVVCISVDVNAGAINVSLLPYQGRCILSSSLVDAILAIACRIPDVWGAGVSTSVVRVVLFLGIF